jgi:hypothetical protein
VTGDAILAGPAHMNDYRLITVGIPRQNAQVTPKEDSMSCRRPPEPFPHGLRYFMNRLVDARPESAYRLESHYKPGGNPAIPRDLEPLIRDRPLLRFGVVLERKRGLRSKFIAVNLVWRH